jgi:hypothetical protein
MQQEDPDINFIAHAKIAGEDKPRPETMNGQSPAMRNLWLQWDCLTLRDGILYKEESKTRMQLILPSKCRSSVLESC